MTKIAATVLNKKSGHRVRFFVLKNQVRLSESLVIPRLSELPVLLAGVADIAHQN